MATTREEVVVDLKVNAKGVESVNTGIQKTAESTTNLNASIGAVTASIGSFIGSIIKASIHMRLFNTLNIKSFTLFGRAQKVTKALVKGQDNLIKTVTGKTIPSFAALAKTLGIVSAAVLALVVAFKAWQLSLTATQQGSEALATTMTAFDIVMRDITDTLAENGGAMNALFGVILGALAIAIPGFTELLRLMLKQEESAKELTRINRDAIDQEIERIGLTANRMKLIAEIQTSLTEENVSMEDQIDLTRQLGVLQAEEAKARVDETNSRIDALQKINDDVEKNFNKRRQNDIEIAKLTRDRDIMLQRSEDILARTDIRIQAIKKSFEEVNDVIAGRGDDPQFLNIDEEVEALERLLLEGYVPFVDGFKFLQQDRLDSLGITIDAMEEMEEEHIEFLDRKREQQIRTQVAWQELGLAGQLQLGAALLNSSAEIAQENFELQKAFKLGEVVMNTAAALIAIWAPPTTAAAPFLAPIIVAQGIASIASISNARPGDTGGILSPISVRNPTTIESASPDFFRSNQSRPVENQIVLVTEDLNTVQNRVNVTEDRASIG